MFWNKKKPQKINLGKVGIITSTKNAQENGVNDKYNKIIIIYESLEVDGSNIRYGKIIRTIPYTEEEVNNLRKVLNIPIVNRKITNKFKFDELTKFGEVLN